jgi:hypothetical protein
MKNLEFLRPKLEVWHKSKSITGFTRPYKQALNDLHKEWFGVSLNLSCTNCIISALNKVCARVFAEQPTKEIEQELEQTFDEMLDVFNMSFTELKAKAKELGLPMRRSADAQRTEILNHFKK